MKPKDTIIFLKSKYNKISLRFAILFGIILIIEFLFAQVFPDWTFKAGFLVITNNILSYLSFWGLVYCMILFFRPAFEIKVVCGILFTVLLGIHSCSEIYPIDTTTQPNDLKTIQTYSDGKKLVVRQYKNAKTNADIQDTVLVKDVYLFRRLYKR
ncbi:MAG: hypothetical protein E6H07_16980 [Bacteroidetes bacterium]|nr:MAG: hypothetical protein E6H07_16980 [Bacteroidota bacterium]